jgi:Bacterial dnaA protein helix-turn-helix
MPEITPTELAREILRELDVRRASAETTPVRCIQLAICQRAGITLREMLSHRRTARLALPRHMAIWLCWVVTGLSTPRAGLAVRRSRPHHDHARDQPHRGDDGGRPVIRRRDARAAAGADRGGAGMTCKVPWDWRAPATLYPWQRVILRLVIATPGMTTREIGDRYYPRGTPSERASAALHELRILDRAHLVQHGRGRWSPGLLAAELVRRSRGRL